MTAPASSPPSVRVPAEKRPHRKPRDFGDYKAPFRVVALEPIDRGTVRAWAPGLYPTVLAAGGVALDVEKRTLGVVEVLDAGAVRVPRAMWEAVVRAGRPW